MGPLSSTSAWSSTTIYQSGRLDIKARTTRHRPGHERLDNVLSPLGLTSSRACSTRNRPGPIDSTSAQARSTRHQFEPARLNIGSGPLYSTSARGQTTRHRPGHERLHTSLGPNGSTSSRPRSARHCMGPLSSTSAWSSMTIYQSGRLDIGLGTTD